MLLTAGNLLAYIAINVAIFGGGFAILFYGGGWLAGWLQRKFKEYVK